ncbi:MAG: NAD(P)-binding domain-containing protein [Gemmatimonadetes bacterium]|nr:NAD(P)-binding domain-containing protein [Gemmatimonadota bacterium]NIR78639.1 NAD(P)-binding domain-containing protein [Gemmatimonadota bacterium]NIT87257.1 NAD(P)-binding domain-containing protein [Gemmatimonadota bacterium]NIU31100.1 NAD(P)-binding domain-containing protein [Gemmatimonadota bacterium]NIU35836.1 NAD(P)-binding domain-containing protein [Gemmatimonadota bacterium]
MRRIEAAVIGGGQAGLAMSRCLRDADVEHVVLERGRIGERWRSERWDSLRLLTPRWQSRLPGWSYRGDDPDGYMTRLELIRYLEDYATSFRAPIETGVTVTAVEPAEPGAEGYVVRTDRGDWHADHVVVATGECQAAAVPGIAAGLSPDLVQAVPTRYRNPSQLPDGGVLVVGASSTGVQLADEIHRSGRPVILSVGRHIRLPRTYRGRDILWWFDRMRMLDERTSEMADLEASMSQPSLQLVGSPDRRTLDLNVLHRAGVRIVGRAAAIHETRIVFDDDLVETTVGADVKLGRLRLRIDAYARERGLDREVEPPEPFVPVRLPDPPTSLDLADEGVRTVLWATGYRRDYPWLKVPVLDARGEIVHEDGITSAPGLYVLGLKLLRTRKSSFIDGVGPDAEAITEHLLALRRRRRSAVA